MTRPLGLQGLLTLRPENRILFSLIAGLQAILISMLLLKGETTLLVAVLLTISVSAVLFSTTGSLFVLAFFTIVIPSEMLEEKLLLPLNFKFYEGLYAIVLFFAALEWVYRRRLGFQKTVLDRPMQGFLIAILASVFIGILRGHPLSDILPDVRFPLYYSVFFIAAQFFDPRRVSNFLTLLIAATTVVAFQYLLAFFAGVNLSMVGTYTRIVRAEGVILPIGILFLLSRTVFNQSTIHRGALTFLLLPLIIAFVICMSRGLWISFAIGLASLSILLILDRQRPHRRIARGIRLAVAFPLLILLAVYGFQALTGAGLDTLASSRFSTATQFEEDTSLSHRVLSYVVALDQIMDHPIIGNGHGATITYPVRIFGRMNVITTSHIDSLYVVLLHRLGIVGLFLFGWLAVRALLRAYRLFQVSESNQTRIFCAGFIAATVQSLTLGLSDATMFIGRFVFIHAILFALFAILERKERLGGVSDVES